MAKAPAAEVVVLDLDDELVAQRLPFAGALGAPAARATRAAAGEAGFLGLTAVGDDHAHADEIYRTAVNALDEEAAAALR